MLLGRCLTAVYRHRCPARFVRSPQLHTVRWVHPAQTRHTLAPLPGRRFVRVNGPDSVTFLQGLMTNDMRHFEHCAIMYAMFLKANGRVFCDTLIYKRPDTNEEHDYLLECDAAVAPRLEKHLKMYRLRKKVQVSVDETFRTWVAFQMEQEPVDDVEPSSTDQTPSGTEDRLHVFKDPRLPRLGHRVLSSTDQSDTGVRLGRLFPNSNAPDDNDLPYVNFRYLFGVGEGEENLLEGKSFPLECNADYLHGVSFHKGCYIGQELTARTYHTGVIRKRLMPLMFDADPRLLTGAGAGETAVWQDAELKTGDGGAVVGKLRGIAGQHGIGLVRIEKIPPGGRLMLCVAGVTDSIPCRTSIPFWWPKQANART